MPLSASSVNQAGTVSTVPAWISRERGACCGNNVGYRHDEGLFQHAAEGHRGVGRAQTLNRRLELAEQLFLQRGGDFGTDAELLDRLMRDDGTAGLFHRGDDRFAVPGRDGAQVEAGWVMCIGPPLPLQVPVTRPAISAQRARKGTPLANMS